MLIRRALLIAAALLSLASSVDAQSVPIQANVSTYTSSVTATPTVSTSAYVSGYNVGGILTFANAVLSPKKSGVLTNIVLDVKSVQSAAFDLCLFESNPAGSYTDHSVMAITAGDKALAPVCFPLVANDSSLGTFTSYTAYGLSTGLVASGTSLYGVLTTQGTPTFASTSDVLVTISVLQDY